MSNTSKELEIYERLSSELTYAADKLFDIIKGLNGIYDAKASANYCLNQLFQPFTCDYYNDTDKFLRDFDNLMSLSIKVESLASKLENAMSARATEFNRRIVKLTEEEE